MEASLLALAKSIYYMWLVDAKASPLFSKVENCPWYRITVRF